MSQTDYIQQIPKIEWVSLAIGQRMRDAAHFSDFVSMQEVIAIISHKMAHSQFGLMAMRLMG